MFTFGFVLLAVAGLSCLARLAYAVAPEALRRAARAVDPVGWDQAKED